MDKEQLAAYGISYDQGLKNCMGSGDFYKKILSMFLEDSCFTLTRKAYAEKNWKELFSRMHELKGISGNAALTTLFGIAAKLVELLRGGTNTNPDEVDRLYSDAVDAYVRACEGIELILAED